MPSQAEVAELADALGSGLSDLLGRVGSTPTFGIDHPEITMSGQNPDKKDRRNWKFALLLLVVLVMALMVMEFNNRLNDLYRLQAERDLVSERLSDQESTQTALITSIAYAESDLAPEEYARREGKMKKAGDQNLIVVPGSDVTPTPVPTPTPEIVEKSNPQRWIDLFFSPLR